MRLEIILEVNDTRYYLDTNGIESIPLTLNIQNIKDISTTQGSFSKSIVIPETSHNRQVFNDISNLSIESTFNPNLRNRAYILADTQMVIEGYFQLTDLSLDYGKHKNTLTLVIFTDNNDFYNVIGEDYIEDLDLSRFDHLWNRANIVNSWYSDYTNGYDYPLIDYGYDWNLTEINGSTGTSFVKVSEMYPALYNRTIWDQIFSEAGFNWYSNSLSTTPFDNLIVPFNGKEILNNDLPEVSTFKVGEFGNSYQQLTDYYYTTTAPYPVNGNPTIPQANATTTYKLRFATETGFDYGDPNNLWNNNASPFSYSSYTYQNTSSFPVTQKFGFNVDINLLYFYDINHLPYFQIKRSHDPNTGLEVPSGLSFITDESNPSQTYLPIGLSAGGAVNFGWTKTSAHTYYFGHPGSFDTFIKSWYSEPIQILPGERVWLEFNYVMGGYTPYADLSGHYLNLGCTGSTCTKMVNNLILFYFNDPTNIFNQVTTTIQTGEQILANSIIPKKIKKRDYILSLIKMFNLIVEPDKNIPKTLNIETRDYYYNSGTIKDWSKKIDLNDPIEVQILGETQNKRTIFKYKDDKDFYNVDYNSKTKLSYGEYQYVTENEFCDGEKKLEIIFSPTPSTYINKSVVTTTSTGETSLIIIPKIGVVNNNVFTYAASNIRILQRKIINGLPSGQTWCLGDTGYTLSSYPYAGHLDDPYTPENDINFGQVLGEYFPQSNATNNNLFTAYWEKMIDEISDQDSRIISCSVYLTPQDIVNFKFNDNIFLDFGDGGQYYKVNKIDYDPTQTRTSKVEFIKTKSITVRNKALRKKPPVIKDPYLISVGYGSNNNTVMSKFTTVNGVDNIIAGNGLIQGDNNRTSLNGAFIQGDNNTSASLKTTIIGNSNNVSYDSTSIRIIGDGNTITNSVTNSLILGNNNTIDSYSGISNAVVIGNNMNVTNSNSITFNADVITLSGSSININGITGITAGGPDKSVQFNDGGSFNGVAGFEYDKVNQTILIGNGTISTASTYSQNFGVFNESNAIGAHSIGYGNKANGDYSNAEGASTEANGFGSHSEGDHCKANSNFSSAKGAFSLSTLFSESSISSGHVNSKLSQKSEFVMGCFLSAGRNTTAKLSFDINPENLILRLDSSYIIYIDAILRDVNGASGVMTKQSRLIKDIGGTLSFIGSVPASTISWAGASCDSPYNVTGNIRMIVDISSNFVDLSFQTNQSIDANVTVFIQLIEIS